jgi:hypothetical protein
MSGWLEAGDESAAEQRLLDLGCTDGLPVVVPTAARVAAFLEVDPSLERERVLGVVPPRMGEATVESVAVNAVMAGCVPGHFPVVCAAVRAVCDPSFTLDVVQATTHNAAVLMIVNGADRLPPPTIASGSGALGPGHRANATIGRALRLVLINAGGGLPGRGGHGDLGPAGQVHLLRGRSGAGQPVSSARRDEGGDCGSVRDRPRRRGTPAGDVRAGG